MHFLYAFINVCMRDGGILDNRDQSASILTEQ